MGYAAAEVNTFEKRIDLNTKTVIKLNTFEVKEANFIWIRELRPPDFNRRKPRSTFVRL